MRTATGKGGAGLQYGQQAPAAQGSKQSWTTDPNSPFLSVFVDNTEGTNSVYVWLEQQPGTTAGAFARILAGDARNYPIPASTAVSFQVGTDGTPAPSSALVYWCASDQLMSALTSDTQVTVAPAAGASFAITAGTLDVNLKSSGVTLDVNLQSSGIVLGVDASKGGTGPVSITNAQVPIGRGLASASVNVSVNLGAGQTMYPNIPLPVASVWDAFALVVHSPSGSLANYTFSIGSLQLGGFNSTYGWPPGVSNFLNTVQDGTDAVSDFLFLVDKSGHVGPLAADVVSPAIQATNAITETLTISVIGIQTGGTIQNPKAMPANMQPGQGQFGTLVGSNGGSLTNWNPTGSQTIIASGGYITKLTPTSITVSVSVINESGTTAGSLNAYVNLDIGSQLVASASQTVSIPAGTQGTATATITFSQPLTFDPGVANGGVVLYCGYTTGANGGGGYSFASSSLSWGAIWGVQLGSTPPSLVGVVT